MKSQQQLRQNLETKLRHIDDFTRDNIDPSHQIEPSEAERIAEKIIDLYKQTQRKTPLNDFEFSKLYAPLKLAIQVHNYGQRDSELPYLVHPFNIGYILVEMGADIPAIAAGILHDAIEHDEWTIIGLDTQVVDLQLGKEIQSLEHGSEIYDIVENLTTPSDSEIGEHGDPKYELLEQIDTIERPLEIRDKTKAVKVADFVHNILTIEGLRDKSGKKPVTERKADLLRRARQFGLPFAQRVDNVYFEQGVGIRFYDYLSNLITSNEKRLGL